MRRPLWLIPVIALLGLWLWSQQGAHRPAGDGPGPASAPVAASVGGDAAYPAFLPREAHDVLRHIATGGPYPHRQDGSTFQNRENRLPKQPRGYYREYTVETPGSDDRGARRIVTGGDPPREYFYSDDHYRSFRRFDVAEGASR